MHLFNNEEEFEIFILYAEYEHFFWNKTIKEKDNLKIKIKTCNPPGNV